MLLLVADDQLVDHAVADAAFGGHLERPLTDLGQVFAGLGRTQEVELAAAGARGLERVIDVGEVLAEQRPPAVAVSDPEILERRDVAEIPDERAHQLGVDAFEVVVRHRGDQCQCALARL